MIDLNSCFRVRDFSTMFGSQIPQAIPTDLTCAVAIHIVVPGKQQCEK